MNTENNQSRPERRLTPEEREIRLRQLKRKRNFRIAVVVVGFLTALSLLISPILIFTLFRVKTFTVEGGGMYTKEQIISASGIALGKNLLFADLEEAADSIEKMLPYTDEVKLTKKLPDEIIIRCGSTEKAFTIEMTNGLYAVTDSNLKVLEITGDRPADTALIIGAVPYKAEIGEIAAFDALQDGEKKDEFVDETLALLLEITGAIAENGTKEINLINVTERSDIYLIYQERIVLRLGGSSDLTSKLSLGNKVINSENNIDPFQFGTVNLSVASEAVFNPSDMKDIPEIMDYLENHKPDETEEENTENDDENSSANEEHEE